MTPTPRETVAAVVRPWLPGNVQHRAALVADSVLRELAAQGYVVVAASAVAADADRFVAIEARLDALEHPERGA